MSQSREFPIPARNLQKARFRRRLCAGVTLTPQLSIAHLRPDPVGATPPGKSAVGSIRGVAKDADPLDPAVGQIQQYSARPRPADRPRWLDRKCRTAFVSDMLSFFRRKPPSPPPEKTFNERVTEFWLWFQEAAPRFTATIDAHKCADLTEETSANVNKLYEDFAWVYGPGADNKGHSLTLSGEGIEHRQLLALYWLSQAPVIPGWTFYASRQAGPIKGHVIEMDDLRIDPKETWITPSLDREAQEVDLVVWHHAWDHITEKKRWTIVFLFLDEVLGEYGTQQWVGKISFGKDRLADSFPLEELGEYVGAIIRDAGWKHSTPGDTWTLFKIEPAEERYSRCDLLTLSTAAPALFQTHMDEKDAMSDLLEGSGADYIYVSIDRAFFPKGDEVAKRGEIEEAIDTGLKNQNAGRLIGGGLGSERGYIDLLIYDGVRSLDTLRTTLKQLDVPTGTMIEFFARDKRSRRIAL